MERSKKARETELRLKKEENDLEISKQAQLARIETEKMEKLIASIGADTIRSIALAGPELQVSYKQSLNPQNSFFFSKLELKKLMQFEQSMNLVQVNGLMLELHLECFESLFWLQVMHV